MRRQDWYHWPLFSRDKKKTRNGDALWSNDNYFRLFKITHPSRILSLVVKIRCTIWLNDLIMFQQPLIETSRISPSTSARKATRELWIWLGGLYHHTLDSNHDVRVEALIQAYDVLGCLHLLLLDDPTVVRLGFPCKQSTDALLYYSTDFRAVKHSRKSVSLPIVTQYRLARKRARNGKRRC